MKNKDFREIQVSSSLLVVIFLGVLALGVFIFLLGVSVGKKQAGLSAPTQIVTQQIPEPIKELPTKPAASDTDLGVTPPAGAGTNLQPGGASKAAVNPAAQEPGPKQTVSSQPSAPKAPAETKRPAPAASGSGLYYVQVAAFTERIQAQAMADRYTKQGYTAVVTNPKPADTKTWYRVRLGGYTSRDRAVDLLAKLNAAAGQKTDFRVVQD